MMPNCLVVLCLLFLASGTTPAPQCTHNPCENGGQCRMVWGQVFCWCNACFKGTHCETMYEGSPCPCLNGGTCECYLNGARTKMYRCKCRIGYSGLRCEHPGTTPAPECTHNPCQNGGECLMMRGQVFCRCTVCFTGTYCQTMFTGSPCPCLNGGTCECYLNGAGTKMYRCRCPIGYSGSRCYPGPVTPGPPFICHRNSCQNGGTCYSTIAGGYQCVCTAFVTGRYCEFLRADVVIMMDSSGSITNFQQMKDFTRNLVTAINGISDIAYNRIRVALMVFSTLPHILIHLDGFNSAAEINMRIGMITTPTGSTNLAAALSKVRTDVLISSRGHRPHSTTRDVVFLLTDGRVTAGGSPVGQASLLKSHGACIYVVGFGNYIDSDMLQAMSSTGTYYHYVTTLPPGTVTYSYTSDFSLRPKLTDRCYLQADIVIMMDASGSVSGNFDRIRNFTKTLLTSLERITLVNSDYLRVALLFFDRFVVTEVYLNDFQSVGQMTDIINGRDYNQQTGGATHLKEALEVVKDHVLLASMGNRQKVIARDFIFLLTDGKWTDADPLPVANALKNAGVCIFVVGFDQPLDQQMLKDMSSSGAFYTEYSFNFGPVSLTKMFTLPCQQPVCYQYCTRGATCVARPTQFDTVINVCQCKPGFSGTNCQIP